MSDVIKRQLGTATSLLTLLSLFLGITSPHASFAMSYQI